MPGFEGLLAGRVLVDRYRVEEVIGRGGMGAVYRAKDERLGRAVAVKVITVTGGADPAARDRIRARFRHEAASAARLPHHPNVVPVYDYGTDPTLGLDFLVMELLRGEDLASRLGTAGPPPLPAALHILQGAARGVAVGHRAGLIHRDVKPGNIFLVRDGDEDAVQVRVLDFGIAKLVEEEDTFTQLTQDGRAPLSPAFASPEQLRGEGRISPAADVFSLGAIAFQMLSGQRPFSDADRSRMSIGHAVPIPSLRARNPAIPPEVEAIVARALAHEPVERFPHAGTMADALDRVRRTLGDEALAAAGAAAVPMVADEPTEWAGAPSPADEDDRTLLATHAGAAPPPLVGEPTRAPRRRSREEERRGRGWFWVILILLATGAGAFAWWLVQGSGPTRVREIPLAELPADTVVTDAVVEEEPDEPDPMDAFIANQEGIRELNAGNYVRALAQFQRAVSIEPDNAEYRNYYGYTLLQMGDVERAAAELEETVRLDPERVRAYGNLADARLAQGDTAGAVAAYDRVLRLSADARTRRAAEQKLEVIQRPPLAPPDTPLDAEPSIPVGDTLVPVRPDTTPRVP